MPAPTTPRPRSLLRRVGARRLGETDISHVNPNDADPNDAERLPHEHTRFAHNSERQFAKLLDFYGIEWDYEPRTFTLESDRDGKPVQAFTPDFYLPAYDLYIEITTLNQRLVTKKNRKARRLQELHPDVRVKVLYQRDYLGLLVKYGLEAPSQLSERLGSGSPLRLEPDPRPMAPPGRSRESA